jgi:Na+/H+ antiporter NhaC
VKNNPNQQLPLVVVLTVSATTAVFASSFGSFTTAMPNLVRLFA